MSNDELLKSNPEKYMPDQSGKVFVITGGTNGLGAQSAIVLAKHNAARIYITGRNSDAAEAVVQKIKRTGSKTVVTFLHADLTDLESVRAAADKVLSETQRVDVLMANAGVMCLGMGLTKQGYEQQFGINHMGNALFIRKLMPALQRTAAQAHDARVIILTSLAWTQAPKGGILFDGLKTEQDMFLGKFIRYAQSKLANILYAKELAVRYPDVKSVSVHPGLVTTGLLNGLPAGYRFVMTRAGKKIPPEEGAWTQLWCCGATDIKNGGFYECPPVAELSKQTSQYTEDKELMSRLYEWTESELSPYLNSTIV
ncbi:dehydrogenase with different specificitie [Xylaria flabelliformis]|nr:dehydrogenase with different specificitie [Xylaria flabelliformis]KAI0858979.1 oxidoreductase [Xylaria cubensis]